jgi:hypothetical protein
MPWYNNKFNNVDSYSTLLAILIHDSSCAKTIIELLFGTNLCNIFVDAAYIAVGSMAFNADDARSMLDDEILEAAGIEPFDLLYDSYNIHFYPMEFFYQLFVHIFFPFTYFMSRNPVVNRFDTEPSVSST